MAIALGSYVGQDEFGESGQPEDVDVEMALFTRTWMRPDLALTLSTNPPIDASSVTSRGAVGTPRSSSGSVRSTRGGRVDRIRELSQVVFSGRWRHRCPRRHQ